MVWLLESLGKVDVGDEKIASGEAVKGIGRKLETEQLRWLRWKKCWEMLVEVCDGSNESVSTGCRGQELSERESSGPYREVYRASRRYEGLVDEGREVSKEQNLGKQVSEVDEIDETNEMELWMLLRQTT